MLINGILNQVFCPTAENSCGFVSVGAGATGEQRRMLQSISGMCVGPQNIYTIENLCSPTESAKAVSNVSSNDGVFCFVFACLDHTHAVQVLYLSFGAHGTPARPSLVRVGTCTG